MRTGLQRVSPFSVAVIVLMAGCASLPSSGSDPARQDQLAQAAKALGPVAAGWTEVETRSICDPGAPCPGSGLSFVSRRKGGTPQAVCAEAVPWLQRSFGGTFRVADCVRAMTGPADSTTTQPGFHWDVLVRAAQVDGAPATWQVSVYADDIDGGSVGSNAAPVPLSYQAGGFVYDGDRAGDVARVTGMTASPS